MNVSGPAAWTSIEELSERHLGGLPSPGSLAAMKKAEQELSEVRELVERAFRLMEMSRFRARDLSPLQANVIGVLLPVLLPSAWGGSVPPFTMENRHKRIDAYLRSNPWTDPLAGSVLLEIGCGFPPQTAIDAARAFPQWQVIGADPCFDEYLVYDERGNYACLNNDGEIRFFSTGTGFVNPVEFLALYQDREKTRVRFSDLFAKLKGLVPQVPGHRAAVAEQDGARIVRHPVHLYETANLKLVQAGLGSELPQADVIRCFNVLVYFGTAFRQSAEQWALRTLRTEGLLICGLDGADTDHARYSVYRREGGRLIAKEFAFSVDNARPVSLLPFTAYQEGDLETWALARLVGVLRSNDAFRVSYDSRLDALLNEKRLFSRQPDGYFAAAADQIPQSGFAQATAEIAARIEQEGFAHQAAGVLRDAGFEAWVNAVGHVAVRPWW